VLRAEGLVKRFEGLTAVDGVSFGVRRGEVFGFLGPNGAGKTTTIRILTGYMPATSGAANVAGFDVFSQSLAARRQIGYLPESVPLYTDMRVREYLNFRAKLRGMSKPDRQKRLERVVEMCWLGEAVDRPIGQLSKGFRQRVGLADALIHDPKVLILDEPTIGLDPTQIREMRNLIRQLGGKHTVLLSSHILPEVEATCDRTIIIAAGRIVAQGTVEQLRHQILGGSRVIAELRGNGQQMRKDIAGLGGVRNVELQEQDGWNRLLIETSGKDVREDVSQMAARKGWNLREIRLEVGSLEEFFVQVVARQHEQQQRQANAAA
jgi:ABC-2 type transport system ATP-binding protein